MAPILLLGDSPLKSAAGGFKDGLREGLEAYLRTDAAAVPAKDHDGQGGGKELAVTTKHGLDLEKAQPRMAPAELRASAKAVTKELYLEFLSALGPDIPVRKCLWCGAYVLRGDDDARCKGSCHQFRNSRHVLEELDPEDALERAVGLTRLAVDWLRDEAIESLSEVVGAGASQLRGLKALT